MGSHTELYMNGSAYSANWNITMITPSGPSLQNVHTVQIKRILNAYQNSVVRIVENQNLTAAEIYSFQVGSIDASIAVKNTQQCTATFVATFVMVTGHRSYVSTRGFSGGSLSVLPSSRTVMAPISSQSWIYDDNYVQVSWQNEMSLFHAGIFMSNSQNNVISLPYGPFSLSANETYSIDPNIQPDRIPPPPGGGGGGGSGGGGSGGGGGGSSGNPPSASISLLGVSSTNNAFLAGTDISIQVDVSSLGTYSPTGSPETMNIYALPRGGGEANLFMNIVVSSTGTYTYTWAPPPGDYSGVKLEIGNYWGEITPTDNQEVKVYDALANTGSTSGPTDGASTIPVRNSEGQLQGYMVIQVEGMSQPVPNLDTPRILLQSAFVTVSGTSVSYIQNFTDIFTMIGNSANTFQSGYFSQATQGIYDGASQSSSYTYIEDALYAALTVLAGEYSLPVSAALSAIGILAFTSYSTTQYTGQNQLIVPVSNPLAYPFYASGTTPDWIFYVVDQIGWQQSVPSSITTNNAVLNYFEYSAYFGLHEPSQMTTITGAISEPIYIAQIHS